MSSPAPRRPAQLHRGVVLDGGLVHAASEAARQESVRAYGLSGREAWYAPDPRLRTLAGLAGRTAGCEFGAVTVFDDHRQWQVSGTGAVGVSPRSISVCELSLTRIRTADQLVVLPDAAVDVQFADNPLVNGDAAWMRLHVAVPLVGREGLVLGTLCCWSRRPGEISEDQRACLFVVRDAVLRHLDARRDAHASAAAS